MNEIVFELIEIKSSSIERKLNEDSIFNIYLVAVVDEKEK
jgi:hypothetical protein